MVFNDLNFAYCYLTGHIGRLILEKRNIIRGSVEIEWITYCGRLVEMVDDRNEIEFNDVSV